jgi:protein-S-isoprenylcysteine O-methyltransferase Ste14
LYKKDYFTIIGTIVAIFAVVGFLINTSDTIYWIPISFFMILLFSIVIILYYFYQSYFIEREKNTDNDFTDVLYLDLFFKNIRPIFYSISLLLLINTICVIIVISGITGVQNIQDVFLNFLSPNLEYAKITINLPPDQKISIENAIKNVETLYILLIIFQTLIVFAFTFIIHKMRPPYPGTKHITTKI